MSITFDIVANGVPAGQQNTEATTNIKVTGDLRGGKIRVFASNEDANYGEVMPTDFFKWTHGAQVFNMAFPADTYFEVSLDGAQGTPAVKVVMW